jgi:hypothetical protein
MRVIVTIVSETVPIDSIAELRRKRSTDENGRFKAQYRKKWLGTFGDFGLLAFRRTHVAAVQGRNGRPHVS